METRLSLIRIFVSDSRTVDSHLCTWPQLEPVIHFALYTGFRDHFQIYIIGKLER